MNHHQIDGVSRRDALQRGLSAIAGVAIVRVTGSSAYAASNKLAKTAVQYADVGNVAGKDCDDCIQFLPGKTANDLGTCKIVEGDISRHGHCLAFSAKPKS
jgi:hypothetical protein